MTRRKETMVEWTEKILIRGVNWLGDAVMTTPALIQLRKARPSAYIALLTPAKLAGLWQGQPVLDEVLTFADDAGPFGVARQLRPHGFDTALIFPNSPRSALESFLAGIPRRIGYERRWRNFFLTQAVPPRAGEVRMHKRTPAEVRSLIKAEWPRAAEPIAPHSHHLYQYLHLAAELGAGSEAVEPRIVVSPDRVAAIRRRFGLETNRVSRPLIGINPGAEYGPAKRWPADRFTAAGGQLRQSLHCDIWILGGPADRDLAASIATSVMGLSNSQEGTVHPLAGETSLQELCAALKACDVVLTNDTGPMHVAAAVGTPVVVPFGSTSPTLTGPGLPGGTRHRFLTTSVPCAPCFLRDCPIDFRCMEGIPVAEVVAAVLDRVHAGRASEL